MKKVWLSGMVVAALVLTNGCGGSDNSSGGGTVEKPVVLTNPTFPAGVGERDEKVRWQTYTGQFDHFGRRTAIKWPASLMSLYGCTGENTRCFVDGTEFFFYTVDQYPSGVLVLSYGSATRSDFEFSKPSVAVLFKDGQPFCAAEFADPMIDEDLVVPPATIELPAWVNDIQ
ncbi:MAG: hypothetical protein WCL44_10820 [bacterium]